MSMQMGKLGGFALLGLLTLAGCGRTETAAERRLAEAEADVAKGGRGLAHINPSPRKPIEITLQIHDAPGPFGQVVGRAQYDVVNEDECGYIHPAAGTPSRMTSHGDVNLTKVSEREYKGVVYLDLMRDEDYFGRGVCRWELTSAGAGLRATGAEEETRFLFSMDRDRILGGGSQMTYYADLYYPKANVAGFPATGHEDPERYKPEIQGSLFAISMSADGGAK